MKTILLIILATILALIGFILAFRAAKSYFDKGEGPDIRW